MLVYRVETYSGTGVYGSLFNTDPCHGDFHPGPYREGEFHGSAETITGHHYFGFRDLIQLRAWFRDNLRKEWVEDNKTQRDKLYISVYDVKVADTLAGKHQMVFIRENATLVKRLNVYTLQKAKGVK